MDGLQEIMKRAADILNITCDQAEERNRLACDGTKEGRGGKKGGVKEEYDSIFSRIRK